jgi:hypothetical protein
MVVDTITTTENAAHEKIMVSADKTQLTLYVNKFSTYAIGYTTTSGASTSKGGSTSSNYSITVTAGTGGGISPTSASVVRGGSKTFTIKPDEGYYISNVLVDGESVGTVGSYTFSNVSAAHTIKALFVKSAGLPYYTDASGNMVFIGFAAKINGEMDYIAPSGVTVLFTENAKNYTDVSGHWASDHISFVTEREIFAGTGNGKFSPDSGMTRAMFATVIGRLYERSYGAIVKSDVSSFTDCDYDKWYGKYVDWAAKNSIITGVGGGLFEPDREITRQEMAVILYRFANFIDVLPSDIDTALNYPDADTISSWAQSAALYCQSSGTITGREGGNFVPQGTATRAEVAVILEKSIENALVKD